MKNILNKFYLAVKIFLQRLVITFQLFTRNGLANHAAACAYGFLLSIAPMLLVIVIFSFIFFKNSSRVVTSIINNIPFLEIIFDDQWLSSDFFSISRPGVSGIIFILSIFWAARILALSVQRALKVIFPSKKKRNPITNTLITLIIEITVLIFVLLFIFSSRTAMFFYRMIVSLIDIPFPLILSSEKFLWIFSVIFLGIISFFAYLFIPASSPRKISAFKGAVLCTVTYSGMALILKLILDTSRYNFLYGAFGNMIILLVNVYFFFNIFFLGAQLTFVYDSFETLLFSQIRNIQLKKKKKEALQSSAEETATKKYKLRRSNNKFPNFMLMLFNSGNSVLGKYFREYKAGDIIIALKDKSNEIFYIIEGEAELYITPSALEDGISSDVFEAGSFFGEMGYLLAEERSAIIKAKTNICVFALSPSLFESIIENDADFDRDIIENMSRRLKNTNELVRDVV